MDQLNPLSHWKLGEAVTGTYCGVAFAGTLDAYTRPTPDYKNVIYSVQLDQPIVVFGQTRKSVEVWSNESPRCTIQVA